MMNNERSIHDENILAAMEENISMQCDVCCEDKKDLHKLWRITGGKSDPIFVCKECLIEKGDKDEGR